MLDLTQRFQNIATHVAIFTIFSFAKEIMFSLIVVWLVCEQDYTKNTELISIKLEWRMAQKRLS